MLNELNFPDNDESTDDDIELRVDNMQHDVAEIYSSKYDEIAEISEDICVMLLRSLLIAETLAEIALKDDEIEDIPGDSFDKDETTELT